MKGRIYLAEDEVCAEVKATMFVSVFRHSFVVYFLPFESASALADCITTEEQ